MADVQQDAEIARRRFIAWLEWFMRTYPEIAPTKVALARGLGITHSAVSQLLNPQQNRAPDFKTLVAAKLLLKLPIDALLGTDPPPRPRLR
jgi:hypothetical protein